MEQCPAKWVFEKYVKKEVIPEEDDTPARRGNVFHDIMEKFFAIDPPEERTTKLLAEITKDTISTKYPEFKQNGEVIQWVKDAVRGYYEMGGNPTAVTIADVPKHKRKPDDPDETEKGLESFVKGQIGDATRETLGFIDQVVEDQKHKDGSVIIADWKSGSKARRFKKSTKSNDGFNEVRQQILYTMLMEQRDVKVSSARLIYPVAGVVINVDTNDEELRVRIVESVEEADKMLTDSIENNTFEYGPSFLCSWCPLVNVCPVADKKPFQKAVDARAKQPVLEDIEGAVVFK